MAFLPVTPRPASPARGASKEALTAATGRPWSEWFELLDAAGAEAWTHPQITRWLQGEQGVPGWWSQAVTVGFEQARGRWAPGQRADGSFTPTKAGRTSVSLTRQGLADAAALGPAKAALAGWLGAASS